MNPRIQELKRQARAFYLEDESLDCSLEKLHQLVDDKFVELLVQECIKALPLDMDTREYTKAMRAILEHFGVNK